MAKSNSLLTGRNTAPLNKMEERRITNTFMGFDSGVSVRYDKDARTVFRVAEDEITGEEFGEIVFGPDIMPGTNTVDSNSSLSYTAAAAHELTHVNRWKNKQAIDEAELEHIDEAMTSLQAICTYETLKPHEIRELVADAMQRLKLYYEKKQNKETK